MADADDLLELIHLTAGYRRALVLAVVLNLGFAALETAGSYFGESQALRADALDFFGDGLISLLAITAIPWSELGRARAALAEGIALGLLGLLVLASTAYSAFVLGHPEAEFMGSFGALALAVNVTLALVLARHRHGDMNARAVWLDSRNDAIGSVAVLVAAALVAVTHTRWPDLFVAAFVAALFTHSSWSIIRAAVRQLRRPNSSSREG